MSGHTPPSVEFDWDAFAAFVEAKRHEHNARPEADAVAASMAAFNRWGVRPPRGFIAQHRRAIAAMPTAYHATPHEGHK